MKNMNGKTQPHFLNLKFEGKMHLSQLLQNVVLLLCDYE